MNDEKRKKLQKLVNRISIIVTEVEGLGEVLSELDEIRSDEEEGYDNLTEGLQAGKLGQQMEECKDLLQDAYDTLDAIDVTDIMSELGNALDKIKDAINRKL